MRSRTTKLAAVAGALALTLAACGDDGNDDADSAASTAETSAEMSEDMTADASADASAGTIVDVAASTDGFSTLVAAVQAADLVDTLSGEGPFTVFAPTNEAFEALPEGTLDTLLADPTGALTDVLQLHVIAGEVDSEAATAAAGTCVETLGGQVKVEEVDGGLTIGGAAITTVDLEASNGVIHVIDSVITAPSTDC